jgi:hypothetical protein
MPDKELREPGKKESIEVTFICQCCKRTRPLKDMRTVTRFLPVLVVCRECEKAMR